MTTTYTLDEAINNYPKLIDGLTYVCYRYNRDRSPDITPEQWQCIFSNTEAMERQYQSEITRKEVRQ